MVWVMYVVVMGALIGAPNEPKGHPHHVGKVEQFCAFFFVTFITLLNV